MMYFKKCPYTTISTLNMPLNILVSNILMSEYIGI